MDRSPYEEKLSMAFDALMEARKFLFEEISAYPTPISGCDQQYIRLISDRTRISQALQCLSRQPFVATPRMLDEVTG